MVQRLVIASVTAVAGGTGAQFVVGGAACRDGSSHDRCAGGGYTANGLPAGGVAGCVWLLPVLVLVWVWPVLLPAPVATGRESHRQSRCCSR